LVDVGFHRIILALEKSVVPASFNHLVGARDDRRRNLKADGFRSFQIDHEFERGWLRNG
jgi:hypothetical protein